VPRLSVEEKRALIAEIFDTLPARELRMIRDAAEEKRREKLDEAKNEVLEEMRGRFEELGVSLEEVFPTRRSRREGGTARVKYRSPHGETWSGRGVVPHWLRQLEDHGHKRDEFLVEQDGAGL
jgi:DNA-binding protein H-NS